MFQSRREQQFRNTVEDKGIVFQMLCLKKNRGGYTVVVVSSFPPKREVSRERNSPRGLQKVLPSQSLV